jgi:hypothetical protein
MDLSVLIAALGVLATALIGLRDIIRDLKKETSCDKP